VVRHQHVTDKGRMIEQKNIPAAKLQVGDITELSSHPFKE
jgi:hypothetical protein